MCLQKIKTNYLTKKYTLTRISTTTTTKNFSFYLHSTPLCLELQIFFFSINCVCFQQVHPPHSPPKTNWVNISNELVKFCQRERVFLLYYYSLSDLINHKIYFNFFLKFFQLKSFLSIFIIFIFILLFEWKIWVYHFFFFVFSIRQIQCCFRNEKFYIFIFF